MNQPNPPPDFVALERDSTLTSRVVGQLESMIADGRLAEGSKLPAERDLARQFGVSRTVVREAVAALSAKELLSVEAGSGTIIRRPSAGAVAHLFGMHSAGSDPRKVLEVRRILLEQVAGLASERHHDDDLERLGGILREAGSATSAPDEFAKWDAAFHAALARATQNETLALMSAMVGDLLVNARVKAFAAPGVTDRCLRSLQAIVKQVRKRDAKSARQAMREHLVEIDDTLAPSAAVRKPK